MKEESILVKAGRKFNDYKGSMNPPVYHSSTILFPTYKDYLNAANGESIYDVINDGVARDYSYSNVGTPTVHYLSNALAEIEGSGQALIYPSGLFALTFAILTFTKAGSHVLIQDNSYYRLKRFAKNELPKRGTEVTFYDPTQDITDLIQSNTSLIMIETPGSVAFEISNVEHIVKVAKERGIVTVCDNSWATPLLFKPLDYGIDVALYAVTKYLAGHSDLLMGAIIAEGEIFKLLYESYKNYGVTIQSHDCYLVHRGLRTLHTRMKRHQNTAMEVAKWLEKHSKIKKVLYPALPSHPQHELWKSYFKGASGTFSIVLDREYSCEELSCMVDHMKIFSIGASWGGCDSLILPIDRRSMSRSVMNSDYGGSFIRIFCGLEDPEDLIFDLNDALKRLSCLDFQNDEVGMKLRELLHDIVDVNFGVEIKGVTCNPKRVKGGYLFVCVSERDRIYIDQILSCGAKAIIASDCITNGIIPARDTGIHIFHPNPQEIYSEIVSRFYQFKQPKYVAAVTGTNGKTSVVEFCRQIWQNAGYNAASIGTLGICINNGRKGNSNSLTTPGADDLYAALRDIDNKNVEHLVLEASSHGVDQYRIHGLKLSAAAFTNFSQDHLDYHKNLSEYLETKKRLFYEILPQGKTAILNADIDEYGALLKIAEKRGNEIITYGKTGSDITLLKQIPTPSGQYLTIKIGDEIYEAFFPILGQFQAYNLLCAIGISGLNYREISIGKLVSPPGRMEKVKPFAFVDYAHTPSALKQALLSLKWHFNKKIILVFGCGGNRDQTKRAEMGKVAQMYADRVIITDDNPRDENPAEIRRGILLHCPNALEIEDRREAIEKGVDIAYNKGMILLVAGKGHERFQIIGNQTFEFSDVEVIKNHVLTC